MEPGHCVSGIESLEWTDERFPSAGVIVGQLTGIKTRVGHIAASATGDFDFGQSIFGFFHQQHFVGGVGRFVMDGGKISGGNFNPAVTIMMAAAKKMPSSDVVPYIIAQIAGGLLALELYKRI